MADNVTLDAGAGGDTIAADDVAGVKYQVVKLAVGADGAAALVANANPIPVSDAGGSVTVDGSVTANAGTNLNTSALALESGGNLAAIASSLAGTLTVGSHAVTNAGTFAVQATIAAGATTIGKAEDAAHSSGDVGVMALSVRQDTAAALAGTDADYQPLITDASGRLHVNVGNTVTVGSHAVTNAGTFVTQENGAALTSLQLIDDAVYAEDVAAQAADKGIAILAVRRDADTSLVGSDNDYANLQVNAAGSLKVAITAGAGSGGTSIADGASFTRDTTSITPAGAAVETSAPTLTNGDVAALSMTTGGALRVAVASGGVAGVLEDAAAAGGEEGIQILAVRRDTAASSSGTDGDFSTINVDSTGRLWCNVSNTVTVASHAVTNAGTFVVQENGSGLTALQLIDDPVFADDAAFTIGTSKVMVAGFTADESSTDSLDEGDAGAARITLDRKLIVTPYAHAAAGGATPFYNLDVDESEDAIKASAGKLMSCLAINRSTGVRYVKFYNATVANVTVGSTTPVLVIPLPTMGDTNGAGVALPIPSCGIQFDTAITVAATTGFADNDSGAPGTNDVIVSGAYI